MVIIYTDPPSPRVKVQRENVFCSAIIDLTVPPGPLFTSCRIENAKAGTGSRMMDSSESVLSVTYESLAFNRDDLGKQR